MAGSGLDVDEREEIRVALTENPQMSWAQISHRIERHRTTVMREVVRNGGRDKYRAAQAQRRCVSKRARPKTPILAAPGMLRERVRAELVLGRSPVAIWADLKADSGNGSIGVVPCVETIYKAAYSATLDVDAKKCLRSRRPRRRKRRRTGVNAGRAALPNIGARPAIVEDRREPGHWEADLNCRRVQRICDVMGH